MADKSFQEIRSLPPVCLPGEHVIDTATYHCTKCFCVYSSPQDRARHAQDVADEFDRIERNWPSAIR